MINALARHSSKKPLSPLRSYAPPFFLLVLLSLLVLPVFAEPSPDNALNITDLAENMSNALGYDDNGFTGGLVLTVIVICLLVFPIVMIGRRRNWGFYPELAMVFVGLCVGVGFEWVSYWLLLMVALLVALMFSGKVRDWASGG